jgi:hypothetical protein
MKADCRAKLSQKKVPENTSTITGYMMRKNVLFVKINNERCL